MAGAVEAAPAREDTFPKLLLRNAAERGGRPAMREKHLGIWQTWTWGEVLAEVRAAALGFERRGIGPGDAVAIVGANRPRLYWSMLAVQSLGAVPVPVYADSVADEIAYVLAHAEVVAAVCQDQEQVDKLISVADQTPQLRFLVYDEPRGLGDYGKDRLHAFTEIQDEGRAAMTADHALTEAWGARVAAGSPDDVSVILYTSGTTGRSKGVMLSAGGCVAAARDTVAFDKLTERDEVLAYLPLAWVGDHYLNYAQALVAGFCIACPESPETVTQDLREIGPSFYFAPPRVFEGLLTRVTIRMEDASRLKRAMVRQFLTVARRHGEAILDGRPVPLTGRLAYALGEILVYGPMKNVLGFSRIRVAYTAGEAIGPDLFAFWRGLGLNLKQLYGQTEAFLYVTCQADGDIRSDTVGPPAPNVALRIADDGEVQFKSPGMFLGYFRDEARTAETMTPDGFVKTGDAGFFTPDGHLKIIDRARDVGRLADATLFAPKYIENKLKFFPTIREAVAFGDARGFVTAMLNIDLTAVGDWAERADISYASYQELAAHPRVIDLLEQAVDQVNRDLAAEPAMAGAQIRRFLVLHKELDADDGELTRTQKVRRGFIADRYAPLIEALYDGSAERHVRTEVTFEDGRRGAIEATVSIRDMTPHAGPAPTLREAAE
jgi:long-chain acyl-CoA synthetase